MVLTKNFCTKQYLKQVLLKSCFLISITPIFLFGNYPALAAPIPEFPIQVAKVDKWTLQVRRQLIEIAEKLGDNGIELTSEPYIGSLNSGQRRTLTISLRKNKPYAIVGVCDNDCSDLDLDIYDENGNLISSDHKANSFPFIGLRPKWTGEFTVKVNMVSCSTEADCRYGIGVFSY